MFLFRQNQTEQFELKTTLKANDRDTSFFSFLSKKNYKEPVFIYRTLFIKEICIFIVEVL